MESDYALRIMRCLAKRSGLTDAKTISALTEVPQRFTLKILGKLVSGGVVSSQKGANGGYQLALPADRISLRRIIEIVEGPLAISRCLSSDFVCRHEGENGDCACFFNRVFDEINAMIAEKLDGITVADSL